MRKLRFLVTFLVLFALLLVLWRAIDGSRWYTAALIAAAGSVGPPLHGWVLEKRPHRKPVWVRGNKKVRAAIQFDALAVGLIPVLALIGATPRLGRGRRVALLLIGAALCFAIDTLIVALFPLLVFYKNPFTDVIGTFLGLIAFVGAPVIIWGALTFRDLQGLLPALRRRAIRIERRP